MTKEVIFKVNTQEAVKSIGDLQVNIKALKEKLKDSSLTWDEQQKYVKQLAENQAALRNAMHGTSATFGEVITGAKGANIELDKNGKIVNEDTYSYNQLSRTLTLLKEQFHSTTNAAERLQVAQKINAVNNKLKQLDASVGTYGRNVGMYQNVVDHLGNAFTNLGGIAPKVATGVRTVTMGFKALSATPALGVLQIILPLLAGLVNSLKSSEEGLEGATSAMGIFSGIANGVTAVVQNVAQGIGWLSKQFVNLLDKLGLVNERMKENQAIAEEEIRVARVQRETIMRNAEAERDIAELRAKSVDKEKYTSSQRIAFLEEASKKENEIAERAKKAAKDEYNLIVRKNAQTKSSAEDLKAEAEAYAKMVQAETNYNNKVRQNLREIERVRKEMEAEARQRQKDEEKRIKEQADAARERLNTEKSFLEQEASLLAKGTDERLAKEKELRAKEYDIAVVSAKEKIKNQEDLDKQLKLLKDIYDADILKMDRDFQEEQVKQALQGEKNRVDAMVKGTEEYYTALIALRQTELDTLAQQDGESDAAYQARVIAAQNAHKEAVLAFEQWKEDQAHQERENELAALEEGTLAYLEKEIELKKYELDTLHQLEDESEAAFQARRLAKQKEVEAAEQSHYDAMASIVQSYAGGLTDIMGSIADIIESGSEVSEAEAKKVKNLRVGAAIVDTISGAIAAYMNTIKAVKDPVTGNILAAVQAAAVTAAGMANVAKIRSTNISTSSSGSGADATTASVQAPSITPEVTQVRSVTSASEEDRLNQMASSQRVYILQSDLEASTEQTKVRVSETTF